MAFSRNNYGNRGTRGSVWPRTNNKRYSTLTPTGAARLLNQATFGATTDSINDAVGKPLDQWFNEQKNLPPTLIWNAVTSKTIFKNYTDIGTPKYVIPNVPDSSNVVNIYSNATREILYAEGDPSGPNLFARPFIDLWLWTAVKAPDQLRQRVAYAFSQIFVVSQQTDLLSGRVDAVSFFYDTLIKNSLGNFRDLLEAVTLTPAMGLYLNMWGSNRPDPGLGIHADENYAREVKQLFTIGLDMLEETGLPKLDSNGDRIPTYLQIHVEELAKKFTGWRSKPGKTERDWNTGYLKTPVVRNINDVNDLQSAWYYDFNLIQSMEPYPAHHDPTCVRILGTQGYPPSAEKISGSNNYVGDTVIPGIYTSFTGNFPTTNIVNQDLAFNSSTNRLYQYQNGWSLLTTAEGDRYADSTTGNLYEYQDSSWTLVGNIYTPLNISQSLFNSYSVTVKKMVYQRYVLKLVLDLLFNHPSTAPFICKQLIQRLVTSNPSPEYVQRVVNTFKDNGFGVRGDLFFVVQSILGDREAIFPVGAGKVREPVMKFTHFWREFKGSDTVYGTWYYSKIIKTANVNLINKTITIPNHGFSDHDPVIYNTAGGAKINELVDNKKYYVIYITNNIIQLSNYPGGAVIQFTSTGNNLQRLTPAANLKASFSQDQIRNAGLNTNIGQQPLYSPTVFNFYPPDYSNPLLTTNSGDPNFVAPEFGIITENSMVSGRNFLSDFIYQYADPNLINPNYSDGRHKGYGYLNDAYNVVPIFVKSIADTNGTLNCSPTTSKTSLLGATDFADRIFISGEFPAGAGLVGYTTATGKTYTVSHNYKNTIVTGHVDTINKTLFIPANGLSTGDRVVYSANNGNSISHEILSSKLGIDNSSTNGSLYYVTDIVDSNNFRIGLGYSPTWFYYGSSLKIGTLGNNTQFVDTGRDVTQFQLLDDRSVTTSSPVASLFGPQPSAYSDTEFANGTNFISRYNNTSTSGVVLTRKSGTDFVVFSAAPVPNSTGWALEIKHNSALTTTTTLTSIETVGLGTRSFDVGYIPTFEVGQHCTATNITGTASVSGVISAYNTSTGILTLYATTSTGVGTYNKWNISAYFRTMPYYGGWYFGMSSIGKQGKSYTCVFTMKIPVGKYVHFGSNAFGTNNEGAGDTGWITDNAGTGDYKEYAYRIKVGTTGVFGTTFYFYINNTSYADTSVAPPTPTFYTYVSSATIYESPVTFKKIQPTTGIVPNSILANTTHWAELALDPQKLVDQLDLVFMAGQMPANMKTTLITYATSITEVSTITDPAIPTTNHPGGYDYKSARVIECVDLILNSPQWSVQS